MLKGENKTPQTDLGKENSNQWLSGGQHQDLKTPLKQGDDAAVKPFNDEIEENEYQLRDPQANNPVMPGLEKRNSDFHST